LDPALWLHVPPGQHISLGLSIDGEYAKRQYTPVANTAGCFDLLIKSYPAPAGLFSRALHSLPLRSEVDVYGPAGRFDFDREVCARQHWILIGQGTGITPLYALIKHVLLVAADKHREQGADEEWREAARRLQMILIDCNRQESEILLHEELQQMEKESEGQLTVQHVLSRTSSRLNADKLHQLLSALPVLPRQNSQHASSSSPSSSPSPYLFLVCGSDEFHADVSDMLKDTQQIREEDIFLF
jgi:nitrate reductase (NAD(P)H)